MITILSADPNLPGTDPTVPQYAPPPVPPLAVERVLGRVRKPGRYAGGEWNSVQKDWASVALKWCFAYPDLYEIGMSNLGLRILYEVLNDRPDRLAERCFSPDVDLQIQLRSARLPVWSLETRRTLRDFDVLGVSLGYELTYTNLLDMLDLSGVPLTTEERTEADPLVIAGGSSVLNPEPIADSLDAVLLGEGEDAVLEISDALERMGWHRRLGPAGEWRRGVTRADALKSLARIPGVYVPSLYSPHYNLDGTFARLEPLDAEAPPQITGRIAADFETEVHGIRQLVPNIAIVFDRAQLEVMRGCTRGCRFCQAGINYRPLRERAPDVAVAAAQAILRATGYEEIGLTSLSTADYTYVNEVATTLHRLRPLATVSLPSTRVDAFTVELVDAIVPNGRRGGFTFAPEAGSQRLRDVINKGVSDEEIARCAELAFRRGWSALKLYFMIGLPGETMDDVLAIADICLRVLQVGRRYHGGKAQVKANVSTFVPKVATPFMWSGQDTTAEIEAKVAALRKAMHGRGLDLRWSEPRSSILEAALGRGDRRLNAVVRRAWRKGARFDGWDEHFRYERWLAAFEEEGLDPAWYAQRDIPLSEHLPWDHLSCGVTREFLARDYRRALSGKSAADCHWGPCYNCGVPAATRFECQTGEQGPRALLVRPETGETEPGEGEAAVTKQGRWRYVGPPGDPRRQGSADGAAERGDGAAERGDGAADERARPEAAATSWPYNLMGTNVQSKSAGLSGLASLVEAAGGESTG
jgi:radical SAM family uncharacterized protein